ncbi:SIR2-domain-containing protein [Mycena belliarum]|uniref:SIR2-domain-containing protein n=1 Tax=Mycena belliarum TaxID=1033014 RepID=A0AAD6UAI1_9AGAR|nr:SIR2-domain-containing protein [Mycena belliae]
MSIHRPARARPTTSSDSPLIQLPASSSQDPAPPILFSRAASQIRAFLSASEEVDINPESVEELVQALIIEVNSSSAEESPAHPSEDSDGAQSDSCFNMEVSELDVSALYSVPDQDVQLWSPQQIRGMMHHLKERGMSSWMNEYVSKRNIPIPRLLLAFGIDLHPNLHHMSPVTLSYFLQVAMSRELQLREKLPHLNSIDDAVRLIRDSRKILILTGAGISVSCGIPDFRSRDGLYASLKQRGDYDLDDPQQMFDISYFRENPTVFYSFASQIYPSNFVPSPCHRFIKLVEDKSQLLRCYTQNVDTLEKAAGVSRLVQCHGSFATASCLLCHRQVPGCDIEADLMAQKVPLCTVCNAPQPGPSGNKSKKKKKSAKKAKGVWDSDEEDESDDPSYPPGIMKPDITFFGEKLADRFGDLLSQDRNEVDLLLVVGTSLKVSPVADILCHLPHSIPQILINKTPIRHINPDIIFLGNADDIITHLCAKLGWELPSPALPPGVASSESRDNTRKRPAADLHALDEPRRVGESHIWLFKGAEGGDWLQKIEERISGHRASFANAHSTLISFFFSDSESEPEQSPKKQKLE